MVIGQHYRLLQILSVLIMFQIANVCFIILYINTSPTVKTLSAGCKTIWKLTVLSLTRLPYHVCASRSLVIENSSFTVNIKTFHSLSLDSRYMCVSMSGFDSYITDLSQVYKCEFTLIYL